MKFTPKQIEGNVNVSKTHPLAELGWLVGGLLLVGVVFYLLLGVMTELAVARIPVSAELWLGEYFVGSRETLDNEPLQRRLQALLDQLPVDSPLHRYPFSVQLVNSQEINALALPGGTIMVFSGLLKQTASENELAMVLAHELGHFAQRDHLRRLGRGLGLTVATLLLFGEESATSDLVRELFLVSESHYSREQESAADRFGLDLLVARYGHAGGATDFFDRVDLAAGTRVPALLASHPHPGARTRRLQELIAANHYRVDALLPLGHDVRPDGAGSHDPQEEEDAPGGAQ